jgi:hypothetical protein
MPIRLQLKALRAIAPGGLRHPPRPRRRFGITRRSLLTCISFAVTGNILRLPNWIAVAQAEERVWRHGLSPFDDLKYPAPSSILTTLIQTRRKAASRGKARLAHSTISTR